MKKETINLPKNKSANTCAFWIDKNYKKLLRKVIAKAVLISPIIPITWEDIYYEFIADAKNLIDLYEPKKKVPFKTYIALKAKFYALNRIKHFLTRKYKILNQRSSSDNNEELVPCNLPIPSDIIDISSLSKTEVLIYEHYFLMNQRVSEICKETTYSRYRVNKELESIIYKLKEQI